MEVGTGARPRGGLAVLGDIIVAPRTGFAELRERAHWGWALAATCVLAVLGAFLQSRAGIHVAQLLIVQNPNHDPNLAALTPEKRESVLATMTLAQRAIPFMAPLGVFVAVLYGALVFTVARAIGHGEATFGKLFALVANIGIARLGFQAAVVGAIVAVRGPLAFSSTHDLLMALPSLAWLVPAGQAKLAALLSTVNPFQIWTFFLATIGLEIVANVRRPVAMGAAAILILTETLVVVASAR